jgi:hypothetical protein
VKGAPRLEDEVRRVSFFLELPGHIEDLPLALAPFAAGVNQENAQCASQLRVRMTAEMSTRSS